MAEEHLDEHFVELVSSVSHANGVFRITLAQQVEGGASRQITRLLIPANQLQAVLRGVADGANEIREKLQNQAKPPRKNRRTRRILPKGPPQRSPRASSRLASSGSTR